MISFERFGKWVELQEFSKEEIAKYLEEKLGNFEVIANTIQRNVILATSEGSYFIINVEKTNIELSFNIKDVKNMTRVVQMITRYDKFSDTEPTFYVEIDKENTRTIIFENGYDSIKNYKSRFGQNVSITKF